MSPVVIRSCHSTLNFAVCTNAALAQDMLGCGPRREGQSMRRPKVITLLGSSALPGTYPFLYKQAHWFVLAAWLICLTTIAAAYKIGLPIIIADAYGDPQLVYPIHKTIIAVITVAVVTALVVAIVGSIALAMGYRAAAGGLVFAAYLALTAGSSAALLLSPRGPQDIFQRHVGKQLYLLPRHNKPPNEASVAEGGGFDFVVCLTPFDERDRSRCQSGTLVAVRPRELGLANWSDVSYWNGNSRDMDRLDDVAGHETYIGGYYDLITHSARNVRTPYYVRRENSGQLLRLVRCYGLQGACEHYTVIGDYGLHYQTDKTELQQWQEIDRRLVQLIDSWRSPSGT